MSEEQVEIASTTIEKSFKKNLTVIIAVAFMILAVLSSITSYRTGYKTGFNYGNQEGIKTRNEDVRKSAYTFAYGVTIGHYTVEPAWYMVKFKKVDGLLKFVDDSEQVQVDQLIKMNTDKSYMLQDDSIWFTKK